MKRRNYKKVTNKIVAFIKETFKEKGFDKAVIGISGGLDSAVVAKLLVLSLGEENVYGYSLPCGIQKDIRDATLVANKLRVKYETIDIELVINSFLDTLSYEEDKIDYTENDKISEGNLKARTRMTILYDMSAYHNALVVGTGNRTELLLGYFTLHGDGACALEPIGHLYKTEVFELAKYLKIPETIINKAPSAGLWDGQTDEGELGATYAEIDKCLSVYDGFANNDYALLDSVYDSEIDRILFVKLVNRIDKNKFKSELPKIIKEN